MLYPLKPLSAITLAISSLLSTTILAGTVTSDGADLLIQTKGGLKVSTTDKKYSVQLGGRIQYDYNRAELNGRANEDQFDTRRARLFVAGKIEEWSFKAQFNIDKSGAEDLYIRYNGFGQKKIVTLGRQKMPFGLEQLTSSKDITFLERSAASELYAIGREDGVVFSATGDGYTYAVAAFEVDSGAKNNDDFGLASRVSYVLSRSDNGVTHLGLAYKNVDNGLEAIGFEFAHTMGSLHFQTEYVDASGGDNGYYLQLGYILTGESRPYKNGIFKRVKPADQGGAWELVARYEDGDGNYSDVELGKTNASAWGLGVNWYANNNVRFGLSYTDAEDNDSRNDGNEFRARAQLTF